MLQQVFLNLILNARDAMPLGGDLVIATGSGSDGTVRIAFRDTGGDIPPDNIPRLFDPFFSTGFLGGDRSGLGLSITYNIVKQLGGSIEAESEPGQGSTFWFTIPAAPERMI